MFCNLNHNPNKATLEECLRYSLTISNKVKAPPLVPSNPTLSSTEQPIRTKLLSAQEETSEILKRCWEALQTHFQAVQIMHLGPQMLGSCEAAAWQHEACVGPESSATSRDLEPELVLRERLLSLKSLASQSAAI